MENNLTGGNIPHRDITYVSPSHAQINWMVSAEDVSSRLDVVEKEIINRLEVDPLDKFRNKHKRTKVNRVTELRGFRPNKYPRNLLWRKHGKEIQERTINILIQSLWDEMIKDKPFLPIDKPRITLKSLPLHGEPIEVVVDVDIWPQINIDSSRYENIYIQVPIKETILESDVDHEIINRRKYYAQYLVTDDVKNIQMGDFVQMRISEKHPGDDDFLPEQGIWVITGSGGFIKVLEESLIGHRVGDEIVVSVDNHGNLVDIRMRIDDHKLGILPTDEELCENEGVSDIFELSQKIRLFLQSRIDSQYRSILRRSILGKIIGDYIFPIPNKMVKERANILEQEARITAMKNSVQYDDSQKAINHLNEIADMVLREETVLRKIAENEGIEVLHGDIDDELDKIAKRDGYPVEDIREWIQREEILGRLENQILCEKTLTWLINKSKISNVILI